MKLTHQQLKQIIREELRIIISESEERHYGSSGAILPKSSEWTPDMERNLKQLFGAGSESAVQAVELWSTMSGITPKFIDARDYEEGLPAVYVGFDGDDEEGSASLPIR